MCVPDIELLLIDYLGREDDQIVTIEWLSLEIKGLYLYNWQGQLYLGLLAKWHEAIKNRACKKDGAGKPVRGVFYLVTITALNSFFIPFLYAF